jgi:protein O-mannosyl-transferase
MNSANDETGIQPLSASGPDLSPRLARFLAGPWPMAVLLALAALSYAGVLGNDFTYTYDDRVLILTNPSVHNFQHLREVRTGTLFANQGVQGGTPYYRPAAMLGFLLCYQLFGPHAFGFHLLSLLLHMAVVGMVFLLVEQVLRQRVAAWIAAALFALHPIHVEAVAWISAVSDLEVTLFYLLTFWLFLRAATSDGGIRIRAAAAMVGSFILAILSKEQALTLPLLATVYEHFYREDRRETTRWQKILRYGPLWLVFLGYILLRVLLMGSFAHPTRMHVIGVTETLFSALALAGQYLGKLVWPAHLSAFYPFHVSSRFLDLPVLLGACALELCACFLYLLGKRARQVSFGILWLCLTLVPVLNARWMSAYVFGERYLYLPSVGFCLVAGWACAVAWQSSLSRQSILRTAAVAAACLVAALCVFRISWRLLDWRDDITLYTETLAAEPDDYRLHDALGLAYWIRGDAEKAEPEWQQTLRLEPNSAQTLDMLGALYAQQRRLDQAVPLLERALRLNPRDAEAHLNLGAAKAEMGNMPSAEEHLQAAVSLSPMNFIAHNLLGKLYFDSKRLPEAEQQFQQSLECEPNLAAYDHLGYIYVAREDRGQAEKSFRAALAMNPSDSHAHYSLGMIYAAAGQNAQAEEELQAALATDPQNAEIRSALEKLRHY